VTRLLAIRLSALGDVIHTLPAVMSLRDSFDVSWVVEKPYAEIVEIVGGVKPIPVRLKRWSLGDINAARRAVRGFDIAVDFQGLIKSALLARVAAPQRFGFARAAVREKPAAMFYNHKIKVDQTQHVVDWNNELARALDGAPPPPAAIQQDWSSFAQDPDDKLDRLKNKIVLLPGAGRMEKIWPLAHFRELVKHYRGQTVVAWGPGELDLAHAIGGAMAPETNLRELAFLLKNARLVVGGDTGPLHLADAVGTRVVGLYGSTDPSRNGPYGQLRQTIRRPSMESITTDEVVNRIDEVLAP
jgi:heptosyltransferase-1